MRKWKLIVPGILMVLIVAGWSLQAGAYGMFSSDPPEAGNCSQCHTTFTSGGAPHTTHTGITGCTTCHVPSVPELVAVAACTECHTAAGYPDEGLFATHGGMAAPNGNYCGMCHEAVPTQARTFTGLRDIFGK